MLEDALAYHWARGQVLEVLPNIPSNIADERKSEELLARAKGMSQRITNAVMKESFDRAMVNLYVAREIAYWREWISLLLEETDDDVTRAAVLEMNRRIRVFSRFAF